MRRIERLINLIAALLETRTPMTAEQVRTEIAGYDRGSFDAFRRTFERDKEALRAMGIPLEVVPTDPFAEQADGYIISKERYSLPDLDLEADELAALRLAALGEQAHTGLLKLSVSSEAATSGGPPLVAGANVGAEHPHLVPLYAALLERHPVRFGYETGRGSVGDRSVEPHALVHRAGHWYLVGRDAADGETKTFKLSRFTSEVRTLPGVYRMPAHSDAGERVASKAWEFGGDEPVAVVVRFDPALRWWAEQNLSGFPTTEPEGGALDVEMRVTNVEALLGWVLEFHGGAEVVSPGHIRARVVEHITPFLS
ncbi:MAG: helix-turn-helix transcriptional regulator [Actinomycetota bacterium]